MSPISSILLPGTIVLAIFVSAMIGGGIIFIDDKARGLHEGYLVTPITKLDLILGFNLSGAAQGHPVRAGADYNRLAYCRHPGSVQSAAFCPHAGAGRRHALALISMMFLIMVRVSDPLVPRAIFGMLNTVLFFPSGAVYPTNAFPPWMKRITVLDPFTYAVHGFKALILKNTGLMAIGGDLLLPERLYSDCHDVRHAAFPPHPLNVIVSPGLSDSRNFLLRLEFYPWR